MSSVVSAARIDLPSLRIRTRMHSFLGRVYDFPETSDRYFAMEGLRGIAILAVFLCHYDVLIVQHLHVAGFLGRVSGLVGRVGTAGVDLFFVLSGFLIYRIVLKKDLSYLEFVRRRAQRIYPPFLAVLASFLFASFFVPSMSRIPHNTRKALSDLLMNLAFLPGFVDIKPIVGVAWSLSYEWYFYLTLPLAVRVLRMYNWTRAQRVAFLVTICVTYLIFSFSAPCIPWHGYPIYRSHVRIVMFLGGIITFELLQSPHSTDRPKMLRSLEWFAIGMTVVALGALFNLEEHFASFAAQPALMPRYDAYRTGLLLAICPLIVFCCCGFRGVLYKVLSCYELRWMGNISYSYYLAHTLGINAVRLSVARFAVFKIYPTVGYFVLLPIAFLASVTVGVILFVFVEKRFSLPNKNHAFTPTPSGIGPSGRTTAGVCTSIRQATVNSSAVKLSVVIPNYNTAAFVIAAVDSALAQTMPWLEVIVVDDGSTDESLQALARINDPRVTIVTQKNRGLAGARNTGIVFSRGQYIGFLDSDDLWHPRKAEKHLALMETHPEIGLTFSYSAYLDEGGAPTGQLLISTCIQPTARDLAFRNHVGNGSTPIIRRECFEEAGMFSEGLRDDAGRTDRRGPGGPQDAQGCEDYEMWVRIAALTPYKVKLVPEVLTGYRVRSNSLSMSFDGFLAQARMAVERLPQYLPSFSSRDTERCYADIVRIASRKALSNGQVSVSRALLWNALRHCPSLVVRDFRAFGMLTIHLLCIPLPAPLAVQLYRGIRVLMRQFYSIFARSIDTTPMNTSAWGRDRQP
jgi:exopolysaccharide production protein ExoZ